MTRISVIIPCYNGEDFLAHCLQSAINQTHPSHEVIVVDDGSSDRSASIAESFDQVTLVKQQNQGVSVARNTGIDAATGEYLLFLDDDDLLDQKALEALANAVNGESRAIGIMGTGWFDDDPEKPFRIDTDPPTDFFPTIIRGNLGCNPNRIVPRDIAKLVGGFPQGMPIYEDWHFWYRVGLCGLPIRCSHHVGAYVRRDTNSCLRSANSSKVALGHVRVMKDLSTDLLRDHPDLLLRWGEELFWSAWTAYHRARQFGIKTPELDQLASNIRSIVRHGPKSVRTNRFARLIRFTGVRVADAICHPRSPSNAVVASTQS